MFLSHTVVPVFVFSGLFYLYSSTDPLNCPEHFDTCDACLESNCYDSNGICTYTPDNCTFQCISCNADSKEKPQYYSKEKCKACCQDKNKECVCDGACYECLPKTDPNLKNLVCVMPTMAVDENCEKVPYNSQ